MESAYPKWRRPGGHSVEDPEGRNETGFVYIPRCLPDCELCRWEAENPDFDRFSKRRVRECADCVGGNVNVGAPSDPEPGPCPVCCCEAHQERHGNCAAEGERFAAEHGDRTILMRDGHEVS